jgi:DNA repair protein RadC
MNQPLNKATFDRSTAEGHRKRIKEKYLKAGFVGWHDYEVLEFLLSYAIPRKDIKVIAKDLLARFRSLNAVFEASEAELTSIKGISSHTALFLNMLKDVAVLYAKSDVSKGKVISTPSSVVNYLSVLLKGSKDEQLWALFTNSTNAVVASEIISEGTVSKAAVFPRKIVQRALQHNAVGVIIAHNHPGGNITPSENDKITTEQIKKALATVDVALLDHLIICDNKYLSFASQGLL